MFITVPLSILLLPLQHKVNSIKPYPLWGGWSTLQDNLTATSYTPAIPPILVQAPLRILQVTMFGEMNDDFLKPIIFLDSNLKVTFLSLIAYIYIGSDLITNK